MTPPNPTPPPLAELRRLLSKATQLDWRADPRFTEGAVPYLRDLWMMTAAVVARMDSGKEKAIVPLGVTHADDAALIVAAVNSLPQLLAAAERVEQAEASRQSALDAMGAETLKAVVAEEKLAAAIARAEQAERERDEMVKAAKDVVDVPCVCSDPSNCVQCEATGRLRGTLAALAARRSR